MRDAVRRKREHSEQKRKLAFLEKGFNYSTTNVSIDCAGKRLSVARYSMNVYIDNSPVYFG